MQYSMRQLYIDIFKYGEKPKSATISHKKIVIFSSYGDSLLRYTIDLV